MARHIGREIIARPEADAQQIANRAIVLGPVEPPHRELPPPRLDAFAKSFQPGQHRLGLLAAGLWRFLGGMYPLAEDSRIFWMVGKTPWPGFSRGELVQTNLTRFLSVWQA